MNGTLITVELLLERLNQEPGGWSNRPSPKAVPRPQPSLRVPVTAANREYLRELRAAESAAWETPAPGPNGPRSEPAGEAPFGRLAAM